MSKKTSCLPLKPKKTTKKAFVLYFWDFTYPCGRLKADIESVWVLGTTTKGPYPKRFEPGNELLAPKLLELMFCT